MGLISRVMFAVLAYLFGSKTGNPSDKTKLQIFGIKIFSRFIFYPTLLQNIVMARISSRQWYNRIDQQVILGALPFRGMVETLRNENVKGIISMNENFELWLFSYNKEGWNNHGIKFLQLSTKDIFEAPCQTNLKEGVEFIKNMKDKGTVYVHCKAGRTRSASLVACYLIEKNNWSTAQAIDYIKSCRSHILLGPQQRKAIQFFHESLK